MTTESPTRSRTGSPQQQGPSSDPASPSQQLRNRGGISGSSSIFVAGGFHEAANTSPTLSSFSSGSNAALILPGRDGSSPRVHTRKLVIRVDHSIATCFDPADKELHDLWAPKT